VTNFPGGTIPPPPPPPGRPYLPPTAPTLAVIAAPNRGVNILAITTLVVGLIPWLGALAIFIGFPALNRIKVTGERGRILVIIGMTFGFLWAIDWIMSGGAGPYGH
jgi:hypothetical protein